MIWLRVSELSLILPFVSMFLDWDADQSYATREEVMKSWCGTLDCASIVKADANRNNLLWRNVLFIAVPADDYTFKSNLLKNGYDTNANRAYWWLMISSWLQVVLWSFSLMPNINKYEAETHSNYDEFSIQDPQESSGAAKPLDENGCDKNGYDIDNNPCYN